MSDFLYDVFISHATQDDAVLIDRVAHALTATGLRVYVDHQRLRPGDEWDQDIQLALRQSRVGLLALSPNSLASPECLGEWRYILNQKRRLYVARIAPVALQDFHSRLCIIQYADLVTDFDQGVAALVQALHSAHGHLDATSPAVRVTQSRGGSFPHDQLDLPIFGRDELLATLPAELLRQHPVLLTGIGGVGKTKLAAVLATTGTYIDGVIWYRIPPAANEAQAQLGLENLTALLRDYLQLPPDTSEAQTWDALGQQQLLLVLDNAEDCLYPAPYAAQMLALQQTQAAVLLTSRHRWPELKNRAHERHLDVPAAEAAEAILTAMVQRGGEVLPLTPAETRALTAAAHYHPRLLEFASGWLKDYEPGWVINRLRELRGKNIEEALREVVGQTIDLVAQTPDGPQALADLRKLVVYRGGFDIAATEALLPATATTSIALLRAWGLLRFNKPRYSVDPLIVAATKPDATTFPVHYTYYQALARDRTERQDYAGLASELENMTTAFEWALQAEEIEKAFWLANAAQEMLHNQGLFAQELQWMQRVAQRLPAIADQGLRAALLNNLGLSYAAQPLGNRVLNQRRAIAAYEASLAYSTDQLNPVAYAKTQNNLGNVYQALAQIADGPANLRCAIQAHTAALRYLAEQEAPLEFAATQNNLGVDYLGLAHLDNQQANLHLAIQAFKAALRHYTERATPLDFAMVQNNLGVTYQDLAELEEGPANVRRAIEAFEAALRHRTEQAAPLAFATTQHNLGICYRNLAQVEDWEANQARSIAAFEAALRHRTEQANPLAFATTQNSLGNCYRALLSVSVSQANIDRATSAYTTALRVATAQGASYLSGQAATNLGLMAQLVGDLPTAITYWQQAKEHYRRVCNNQSENLLKQWLAEAEETMHHLPPTP